MKRFFNKILSIFLTFAVLFTTTSFTVSMHFCCDELIDVAVFSKVQPCNEKVQKTEESFKICIIEDDDCCSSKSIVKQGDYTLRKVNSKLDTENKVFLHTLSYTYVNLFENLEKKIIPFLNYDSPLIVKDIPILYDTFLI